MEMYSTTIEFTSSHWKVRLRIEAVSTNMYQAQTGQLLNSTREGSLVYKVYTDFAKLA